MIVTDMGQEEMFLALIGTLIGSVLVILIMLGFLIWQTIKSRNDIAIYTKDISDQSNGIKFLVEERKRDNDANTNAKIVDLSTQMVDLLALMAQDISINTKAYKESIEIDRRAKSEEYRQTHQGTKKGS